MLERALLLILVTAAVLLLSFAVRYAVGRRIQRTQGRRVPDVLDGRIPEGQAAIVYFYGPHCGPCVQQAAVIDRIERDGEFSVARIDAVSETAVADALGVMTVPATAVVDTAGMVRALNLGFRTHAVLRGQLDKAARPPEIDVA